MTPQVRTATAIRHRVQPIARWLVLATALLILYGSLFPFQFSALGERGLVALFESLRFQPTSRGDLVANLLLYIPFGLCLVLAWPAQWRRLTALAATVIMGTLLSLAVELLQVYATFACLESHRHHASTRSARSRAALIAIVYLELGTHSQDSGLGGWQARPGAARRAAAVARVSPRALRADDRLAEVQGRDQAAASRPSSRCSIPFVISWAGSWSATPCASCGGANTHCSLCS